MATQPRPLRFPGEGRGPVSCRQMGGASLRITAARDWTPAFAREARRGRQEAGKWERRGKVSSSVFAHAMPTVLRAGCGLTPLIRARSGVERLLLPGASPNRWNPFCCPVGPTAHFSLTLGR